jgi:hypothetical protein
MRNDARGHVRPLAWLQSDSETAPSNRRISLDVGPSSRNDDGLWAAINAMPQVAEHRKAKILHHQVTCEAVSLSQATSIGEIPRLFFGRPEVKKPAQRDRSEHLSHSSA